MKIGSKDSPMTLSNAGALLRKWQLNEWALDRRMTKRAKREQQEIIKELLQRLCHREVTSDELDHILTSMN